MLACFRGVVGTCHHLGIYAVLGINAVLGIYAALVTPPVCNLWVVTILVVTRVTRNHLHAHIHAVVVTVHVHVRVHVHRAHLEHVYIRVWVSSVVHNLVEVTLLVCIRAEMTLFVRARAEAMPLVHTRAEVTLLVHTNAEVTLPERIHQAKLLHCHVQLSPCTRLWVILTCEPALYSWVLAAPNHCLVQP